MILAHLWPSSLFAAAAAGLTLGLRKNRARTRYWVWLAGVVKFLVPFGVLVSLGGLFSVPRWAPKAPVIVEPAISFVAGDVAQPVLTAAVAGARSAGDYLTAVLVGVWVCGFLAIAFCWGRRWTRIRADVRAGTRVAMEIGIPVVSSPVLREPGVFGIFRPVLLLPEGMAEHLSKDEWDAVLAHELCHVRCYDNLTAAIYMLVETIFWFHPLVWWMGKRLVAERERACDEEVLRLGNAPGVYAEGILKVCERYLESPLECVAGVTGSNLRRRIRTIMTHRGTEGMSMGKKLLLAAAGMAAVGGPIVIGVLDSPSSRAQSAPGPTSKFEVASIRRCDGSQPGPLPASSPGRLTLGCTPVANLIVQAYTPRDRNGRRISPPLVVRVEGGPGWVNSDLYEINAKAEDNAGQPVMRGPMMQALLEDRFKLKLHRETREIPAWALTREKGDVKLRQLEERGCTPRDLTKPFDLPKLPTPGQKPTCKGVSMGGNALKQSFTVIAEGASLDMLSGLYPIALDRPVIDKTGVKGVYSFHLEFAADETTTRLASPAGAPAAAASEPAGPSIVTALKEQLGLKLEKATGPGEFLIIDSVEKPTPN